MKEKIQKFTGNAYIVLLITVFKLWDIIKPLINSDFSSEYKRQFYKNYDWVGFSIQIVTVILLFLLYRLYLKLRNELITKTDQLHEDIQVSSIVTLYRSKRSISKQIENLNKYTSAPNAINADEAFRRDVLEEYEEVKKMFSKAMPEKSLNEIKDILNRYYPSLLNDLK